VKWYMGDLSAKNRREILDEQVADLSRRGYSIVSRTFTTAELLRPKRFSYRMAGLSLLLFGVGFIVYILWYGQEKDSHLFISVDEQGAVERVLVSPGSGEHLKAAGIVVGLVLSAFMAAFIMHELADQPVQQPVLGKADDTGGRGSDAAPNATVPSYELLGGYLRNGQVWENVQVESGINLTALVALANDIHKCYPDALFQIFDDDEQFEAFKAWDEHYGLVYDEDGEARSIEDCLNPEYCRESMRRGRVPYPYPKKWTAQHLIAWIMSAVDSSGAVKWHLHDADGEVIVDLE